MIEQSKYSEWVDRYVRDELSGDELVVFEEQLLEDTQLQVELEAVLVIKETLKLDDEEREDPSDIEEVMSGRNQWSSMAIAASVLLAVVSTTLYWRTSVEAGHLRDRLVALEAPRTAVLSVPVNIMRSAATATPDVIIQKPAGQGVIVLDIELSVRFQELDIVNFRLQTDDSNDPISWSAFPGTSGRASVVLYSEAIPDGLVSLQMSDPSGELLETRLLEFRKSQP